MRGMQPPPALNGTGQVAQQSSDALLRGHQSFAMSGMQSFVH